MPWSVASPLRRSSVIPGFCFLMSTAAHLPSCGHQSCLQTLSRVPVGRRSHAGWGNTVKSALSVDLEPRQKEVREWMWFLGCVQSLELCLHQNSVHLPSCWVSADLPWLPWTLLLRHPGHIDHFRLPSSSWRSTFEPHLIRPLST